MGTIRSEIPPKYLTSAKDLTIMLSEGRDYRVSQNCPFLTF